MIGIGTGTKKYVVLEHIKMSQKGFRFWTTNSDNNTHSVEGEIWYKEVLFTDDQDEAISESQIRGELATQSELLEYLKNIERK